MWLRYGGHEIGNANRVMAYLRNGLVKGGGATVTPYDCSCTAIGGTYFSPQTDDADWFENGRGASGEFMGFMPTSIEMTGPWERMATTRANYGSVLGCARLRGRSVGVRGVLVASSGRGMAWGSAWLSEVLSDCSCSLEDLCLAVSCDSGPSFDAVQSDTYYADNQFRTLMRVGLVDGPIVRPFPEGDCTRVMEASFQLASEQGWLYADDEELIDNTLAATRSAVGTTEDWMSGAALRFTIRAGSPSIIGSVAVTVKPTLGGVCPVSGNPAACASWTVAELPPGTVLVVDGTTQTVEVRVESSGVLLGGLEYLTFTGPFQFGDVAPCSQACIVATPTGTMNTDSRVLVEMIRREV
jgi:hypothetical protein